MTSECSWIDPGMVLDWSWNGPGMTWNDVGMTPMQDGVIVEWPQNDPGRVLECSRNAPRMANGESRCQYVVVTQSSVNGDSQQNPLSDESLAVGCCNIKIPELDFP